MIRNLILAASLSLGALTLVASPVFANEPKKEEMKCDKDGKSCKDGAECKPENCHKGEKK